MSDFMTSAESPAVGVGPAGKAAASSNPSGNGNWGVAAGMDQITVVRIDDTHIAEEHSHNGGRGKAAAFYEMEYLMPPAEEEEGVEEEEEDGVYVIEYSNPEEEGESYQFMMSVDRPLPAKMPALKHPAAPESARAPSPTAKPSRRPRQKRKRMAEEEEEVRKEKQPLVSNMRILELGEDYGAATSGTTSGSDGRQLVCTLCPPPGRSFKRASGLAVHLKHMHFLEGNKTFFCEMCKQPVRTQIELDAHTKRHANQSAVFTCSLCPAAPGYRGSRLGLKRHLMQEHPGVVPRCDVCGKGFSSLASYLADQFRHVGVSPFFCARCRIYEMTERGLSVHIRNDERKRERKEKKEQQQEEEEEEKLQESGGTRPQTVRGDADNSATDDSDF
ncbi:zinc finger protein 32 [Cyclopterus lumpus]|uniref:zinc finger protein 32 n=1 Tax=Cyclopterus lumpus TaxID=8103 RepID=UPI001485EB87|nr:zinc finger protein 32 [Cyclopterus lumpus]